MRARLFLIAAMAILYSNVCAQFATPIKDSIYSAAKRLPTMHFSNTVLSIGVRSEKVSYHAMARALMDSVLSVSAPAGVMDGWVQIDHDGYYVLQCTPPLVKW